MSAAPVNCGNKNKVSLFVIHTVAKFDPYSYRSHALINLVPTAIKKI